MEKGAKERHLRHLRMEEILKASGALLDGHFILTSGKHGDRYMQCAQILQYPEYTEEIVGEVAKEFMDCEIETVIGPATGGIILAYEYARKLHARSLFTERENGKMTLRRGFGLKKGERVLVVEDVITTGGTVYEVIDLCREAGAEVVGVALIIDRSRGMVDFGVKTEAAYTTDVVAYDPDDCPLCLEGLIPAVKPGSRGLK